MIVHRTAAVTGATGAFGSEIKKQLEREGVIVTSLKYGVDWTYDNYSLAEPVLRRVNLLILAHGSKLINAMEANYSSYRDLIELFMKLKNEEGVIPEIWAVGSEIELHPSFWNRNLRIYSASKRKYAKYAAELYHKKTVVYRHIVPAAFRSRMGPGLMSAKTAAAVTTFFVHRDWKYIPVTYTGIACLNYLKFVRL